MVAIWGPSSSPGRWVGGPRGGRSTHPWLAIWGILGLLWVAHTGVKVLWRECVAGWWVPHRGAEVWSGSRGYGVVLVG